MTRRVPMDEIAKREIELAWQQVRYRVAETTEAAGSVAFWLRKATRATMCLTGRHRWGSWRPSSTILVPPESSRCARCGGTRFRGELPVYEIRIEKGSFR